MSEGYDTPRADDDLYYERYLEGIHAWREDPDLEEEQDEISPDPEKTQDEDETP